jgi:hypothetical protein
MGKFLKGLKGLKTGGRADGTLGRMWVVWLRIEESESKKIAKLVVLPKKVDRC